MAEDTNTTTEETKSKRGGKRSGAGRKVGYRAPHTLQSEQFRKRLIEKIIERQDPIINKLLERAEGGSEKALEMVMERIIGRPITPLEHQGEGLEQLTNAITKILTGKSKKE